MFVVGVVLLLLLRLLMLLLLLFYGLCVCYHHPIKIREHPPEDWMSVLCGCWWLTVSACGIITDMDENVWGRWCVCEYVYGLLCMNVDRLVCHNTVCRWFIFFYFSLLSPYSIHSHVFPTRLCNTSCSLSLYLWFHVTLRLNLLLSMLVFGFHIKCICVVIFSVYPILDGLLPIRLSISWCSFVDET